MPSVVAHAFFPLVMGKALTPKEMTLRFWTFSVLCSILPDIDTFGIFFGIRNGEFLGHRGFTHSLFFAALLSLLAVGLTFKHSNPFSGSSWKLWLYFFFLSSSHGFLDSMTNGGQGVAFFSPLDTTRYFFPWRPMKVSPIGLHCYFGPWGGEISLSEIIWVWIPSLFLLAWIKGTRRWFPGWILRESRTAEG